MKRKILSLLLALVMLVGVVPTAFAGETKPIEEVVTINIKVNIPSSGVLSPEEPFYVPVSNQVTDKEAVEKVVEAIKKQVVFEQYSEYKENSVVLTPKWEKDIKEAVEANFEVATMPKFSIYYSNKVTNINEHLKDFFVPNGTDRQTVLKRIEREIAGINFEKGFEFESYQILGSAPFDKAVSDVEYTVYVYAKQSGTGTGTTPVDPSKPSDPTVPSDTTDLNKLVQDITKNIRVKEGTNGKASIQFPEVKSGLALDVKVRDAKTNTVLSEATIEGKKELVAPITGEETNYRISMVLRNKSNGNKSTEYEVVIPYSVKDTAPTLNYAYVIDGRVVLNITSPVGLSDKQPILYRLKGETDFQEIDKFFGYGEDYSYDDKWGWDDSKYDNLFDNKVVYDPYKRLDKNDYAIDVTVPCVLQVIATDKLGHRTPIQLEIKEDNKALTKNAPKYLNDLMKAAFEERVDKYGKDRLVLLQKNTSINLFDTFEKEIVKEFKRFNIRDVEFYVNEEEVEKWQSVKFEETGKYNVSILNSKNGDEFVYTVLVTDKNKNVKSFKVVNAKAFSSDKFRGSDALEINKIKDSKDVELNEFFFKYDGEFYPIDTEIPFGKNNEVEIEVYKRGQSKGKKATLVKGDKTSDTVDKITEQKPLPEVRVTSFTDVPVGMWYYNYVMNAAKAGLIAGYPDGSFKPNNMISKQEVLAMVGRIIKANPAKAKAKSMNPPVITTVWGNEEIGEAVARLDATRINLANPMEAITREEVAYIIDSALNLNPAMTSVSLSDVSGTRYEQSINTLASAGIIDGYTNGTYRPTLQISRAELAKIILTAYQN